MVDEMKDHRECVTRNMDGDVVAINGMNPDHYYQNKIIISELRTMRELLERIAQKMEGK